MARISKQLNGDQSRMTPLENRLSQLKKLELKLKNLECRKDAKQME